jgi:hypothetical protein
LPSSPSPTASDLPAVQPCHALDAATISKALGARLTVNTGTTDTPRCALVPSHRGDPVFTFNYQWWYAGGLDAAFRAMDAGKGTVSDVKVAGADAAKLVQQATPKQFFITGYVENSSADNNALIQVVNGEALAPYSKARMLAATRLILEQLSKGAPAA